MYNDERFHSRQLVILAVCYALAALFFAQVPPNHDHSDSPQVNTVIVADTVVLSPSEWRDHVVTQEARRLGVDTLLALAVSHVENTRGIPNAVSSAGALGIMQVMPFWFDVYGAKCGQDIFNPRVNACLGVHVLAYYEAVCDALEGHQRGDTAHLNCVLARYNGAVTPWKAEVYIAQVNQAKERLQ